MYEYALGVPQDYKTAEKWHRLAAEQGYADAQLKLGLSYAKGEGVLQDYVYAHMWGNISASNGNKSGVKVRDLATAKMTLADTSTAHRLTGECVRKKYKGC
jgi:TPR repeat protein